MTDVGSRAETGGRFIMMRSLYSGVSGLKVHQTKMDVIGNNISNVNTVGFKASTVTFSDILYQTTQSATGPNSDTGTAGRNAKQIGLGANLASITASMTTTGGSQRTDNPFDVMIEGDAFFVVNNGKSNYFTKAGAFMVDARGTLCTPTGATVMGWQPDTENPGKCLVTEVSPLRIMSAENQIAEPEATTDVTLTGNIDSKDTQLTSEAGRITNIAFYDKLGHYYTMSLKVQQVGAATGDTDAVTNQYKVNVADIKDETGKSLFVSEVKDDEGNVTYVENEAYSGQFAFSVGDTTIELKADNINEQTGEFTLPTDGLLLNFDSATGKFVSVGTETTADNGALETKMKLTSTITPNPFADLNIDFSSLTMYQSSGATTIEPIKGNIVNGAGAGKPMGNLSEISIDDEGRIYGNYDNGDQKLLGQIAVATFANPAGMEAIGNNMFASTQNSGEFDGIGENVKSSGGKFNTGVLEMSNVDLAGQFTDMITTQRGFQANSRIITTSDSLLEELINLKR